MTPRARAYRAIRRVIGREVCEVLRKGRERAGTSLWRGEPLSLVTAPEVAEVQTTADHMRTALSAMLAIESQHLPQCPLCKGPERASVPWFRTAAAYKHTERCLLGRLMKAQGGSDS